MGEHKGGRKDTTCSPVTTADVIGCVLLQTVISSDGSEGAAVVLDQGTAELATLMDVDVNNTGSATFLRESITRTLRITELMMRAPSVANTKRIDSNGL